MPSKLSFPPAPAPSPGVAVHPALKRAIQGQKALKASISVQAARPMDGKKTVQRKIQASSPPVGQPQAGFQPNPALRVAQAKMAAGLNRNRPALSSAPPVYRPVIQRTTASTAHPTPFRAGAVERRSPPPVFNPSKNSQPSVQRSGSAPVGPWHMGVPSTIQRVFTHGFRQLDKDDIRIIYKNLQAQDLAIAEKFKKAAKTKRERSLRAWLDSNGIKTAVKDLLDDDESPGGAEGGFMSDVGSDSEQEMVDAEEAVSGLKKGAEKQEKRGSKLIAKGKHIHSRKALHLASRVAVGDATSQMTSALAQEEDGSEFFQMTASCAPLQSWVESFDGIVVLDVGRGSLYPDGSHVHAEMRMLAARLRAGKGDEGTRIIVSKPCCPVCFDVLTAFGWVVIDPKEKGEYFKDWGNPFEKKDEAAWFNKADKVAQKHSENCKIHKPF